MEAACRTNEFVRRILRSQQFNLVLVPCQETDLASRLLRKAKLQDHPTNQLMAEESPGSIYLATIPLWFEEGPALSEQWTRD